MARGESDSFTYRTVPYDFQSQSEYNQKKTPGPVDGYAVVGAETRKEGREGGREGFFFLVEVGVGVGWVGSSEGGRMTEMGWAGMLCYS